MRGLFRFWDVFFRCWDVVREPKRKHTCKMLLISRLFPLFSLTLHMLDPYSTLFSVGLQYFGEVFIDVSRIWKLHGPASIWEHQKRVKLRQKQIHIEDMGESSFRKLRRAIYYTLYRMDPQKTH